MQKKKKKNTKQKMEEKWKGVGSHTHKPKQLEKPELQLVIHPNARGNDHKKLLACESDGNLKGQARRMCKGYHSADAHYDKLYYQTSSSDYFCNSPRSQWYHDSSESTLDHSYHNSPKDARYHLNLGLLDQHSRDVSYSSRYNLQHQNLRETDYCSNYDPQLCAQREAGCYKGYGSTYSPSTSGRHQNEGKILYQTKYRDPYDVSRNLPGSGVRDFEVTRSPFKVRLSDPYNRPKHLSEPAQRNKPDEPLPSYKEIKVKMAEQKTRALKNDTEHQEAKELTTEGGHTSISSWKQKLLENDRECLVVQETSTSLEKELAKVLRELNTFHSYVEELAREARDTRTRTKGTQAAHVSLQAVEDNSLHESMQGQSSCRIGDNTNPIAESKGDVSSQIISSVDHRHAIGTDLKKLSNNKTDSTLQGQSNDRCINYTADATPSSLFESPEEAPGTFKSSAESPEVITDTPSTSVENWEEASVTPKSSLENHVQSILSSNAADCKPTDTLLSKCETKHESFGRLSVPPRENSTRPLAHVDHIADDDKKYSAGEHQNRPPDDPANDSESIFWIHQSYTDIQDTDLKTHSHKFDKLFQSSASYHQNCASFITVNNSIQDAFLADTLVESCKWFINGVWNQDTHNFQKYFAGEHQNRPPDCFEDKLTSHSGANLWHEQWPTDLVLIRETCYCVFFDSWQYSEQRYQNILHDDYFQQRKYSSLFLEHRNGIEVIHCYKFVYNYLSSAHGEPHRPHPSRPPDSILKYQAELKLGARLDDYFFWHEHLSCT